ncbi:acyl-coenzyme A synthetase ACSM4, mitochondrial-like, partial [Saccoglossus kowalevskii]
FAVDVVDAWAEKEKTNERDTSLPALWWVNSKGDELKWSFQDLKTYSTRTAKFLHNVCGIRKGDRVIVILHRVPEWWLVCLGCKRIGAVICPGSPQLTADDIAYRLNASKATAIVTDEKHAVIADQYENKNGNLKIKILVSENKRER